MKKTPAHAPRRASTRSPAKKRKVPPAPAAFPIVGVGASAGGLEAFTQLLGALPLDSGMGFVLVQHLDPAHESALVEILARATRLPVAEIRDGQPVLPDHVYVIPRAASLSIEHGVLKLARRVRTRGPHRPIDAFFEALAHDQRERAIGVVLSGTASDGTLGLEAIKAEGGITFAQDASAKQDSMPRSAVAAGCVDVVLSPAEIAAELARIARHPGETSADQPAFRKILLLLRNHSGVDFSLYKASTIQRRVARRVVLARRGALEDYATFLRGNIDELDALYSDALIAVTGFFRNPETFDALARHVLPELIARRGDGPLRFWVAGCSTGQEAYSLAMAFDEVTEGSPRARTVQIFATDLNEALLARARQGLYPRSLAAEISPARLRRFFVEEQGGYRVVKSLRERVVFARQNLVTDPPFSRMDLVSCRNLLIYLEPGVQQSALPTFHYALRPGGFLVLGASESIGSFTSLFEPIDRKHKIFAKKPAPLHTPRPAVRGVGGRAPSGPSGATPRQRAQELAKGVRGEPDAQREADRVTLLQFGPPGVLIDEELHVVQFRGSTGAFLEPPVGRASFDVLKMARPGLMLPLRTAIAAAKKANKPIRKRDVQIEHNGGSRGVDLEVIPLKNLRERCFLLLFHDVAQTQRKREPGRAKAGNARTAGEPTRRIAELEAELAQMREYMQSMQEQHDAANEEVQSANEEVQSANEELQSVNEELETSKEELESANEELTTVNEEMARRNEELGRLNDDLVNLQASARLAIVLLGRDSTIRRFSVEAEKQFELLLSDVGRPLDQIRHGLSVGEPGAPALDLGALVADVIAQAHEQEREVLDRAGRWHSLRVRPYLTLDGRVDGATLVLLDIDALKRSEQAIAAARDLAENTLETVREPLLLLDGELRVERANRSFYRDFQVGPRDTIGRRLVELGNGQWDIAGLVERLETVLAQGSTIEGLEIEHDFEQLGSRTMRLNARRLEEPHPRRRRILLAIDDVTVGKHAEDDLRRHAAELADADLRKNEFLAMLGHELRNPLAALSYGLDKLGRVPDADVEELRGLLVRQTRRMSTLLDQLLDIARVVSGKVELASDRVDLAGVVRRASETVGPLVDAQHHALTLALPEEEPVLVRGDAVRLEQVVENLIANAAKYTEPGGKILVTLSGSPDTARIAVRDSGLGMSPEFLPHVFDVFTQAPRTLDRAKGGLGLGLPLVRRMVGMHGGAVAATSAGLGLGSEFVVTLPRLHEAPPSRAREPLHAPGGPRPRRILIVDDETDTAEMLAELLGYEGHQAHVAHDGPSALAAVRTFEPEVVLLDLGLPEMDGYEVARRLRDSHGTADIQVIALTGYRADAEKLRAAGFDDHLIKPTDLRKLGAAIAARRSPRGAPQ